MYFSHGKAFASSKTVWVLFIPLITVSNVSIFEQFINECNDEFDEQIRPHLSARAQSFLENSM